ncbi:hypothetical protein DFJ73DRAFT_800236 [Zopfochytrium polystomum]|nr:hypothetical protein DFJ73DRAFT_800236 [Zopfochytrium polystomum]
MSKKLNFLVAALMVVLTATATTTQAKPAGAASGEFVISTSWRADRLRLCSWRQCGGS